MVFIKTSHGTPRGNENGSNVNLKEPKQAPKWPQGVPKKFQDWLYEHLKKIKLDSQK
jgi:hypothetical protein